MRPEHAYDAGQFGDLLARTPPPEGDRLAELRRALAECEAAVLAARRDEDRRMMSATDRLLAGLELGRADAGQWSPVSLLDWLVGLVVRLWGGR